MGKHARITGGYIEIDTTAWIKQRTSGPHEQLTTLFTDFSATVSRLIGPTMFPLSYLHLVEAFIVARSGKGWAEDRPDARTHVETHHGLSLDQGVVIHRYCDRDEADATIITATHGPYVTGIPTVYAGTGLAPQVWTTLQADITCSGGHRFRYGPGTVSLDAVPNRPAADVFPEGRLIITAGQPERLLCPRCGSTCDVEMADL